MWLNGQVSPPRATPGEGWLTEEHLITEARHGGASITINNRETQRRLIDKTRRKLRLPVKQQDSEEGKGVEEGGVGEMGRGFSAPLEKEGLEEDRGGKVGGGREKEIENTATATLYRGSTVGRELYCIIYNNLPKNPIR